MTRKNRSLLTVAAALCLATGRSALAAPGDPVSLGQQPINPDAPVVVPPPVTPHQLNQLFQFPTTTDTLLAGEGYVSGQFDFLSDLPGGGGSRPRGTPVDGDQFRFRAQGQYGVTDHLAVGGYLPVIDNAGAHGEAGFGDLTAYGQYRLDQVIDPNVVDVTVQLGVVLPTGDFGEYRDNGRLGIQPVVLAYKDFGKLGPGVLGAYGMFGFTFSDRADLRAGVAATYEVAHWAGIVEFYGTDQLGPARTRQRRNFVTATPGIAYRGFRNLDLALGVPIGLSDKSPDVGLTLKFTYAFPN